MGVRKEHIRHSRAVTRGPRWQALRMSILDRDGHACRQCGDRGRLEVDHIKPVRTHPALAYDPANLQALCPACHTRKTRLECGHPERSPEARDWARMVGQLEAGQTDAFSIPYQLRPSAVPVELIAGPPAAGKSTYAKAKAGADDVIIDLNDCLHAASGEAWTDDRDTLRTAFRARDKALRGLADRRTGRALFIISAASLAERMAWKKALLRVSVTVIDTPASTCKARIRAERSRHHAVEKMCALVDDWWRAYAADGGSTQTRKGRKCLIL